MNYRVMSTSNETDAASKQYNLYRLLSNDDTIPVYITDLHITDDAYYAGVTVNETGTLEVYIRIPRILYDTAENSVKHSPVRLLAPALTTTDDGSTELQPTEQEIHINALFDAAKNRSGDIEITTPHNEHRLEMVTELPGDARELTSDEKDALRWKTNVIDWYQSNTTPRSETSIDASERPGSDRYHTDTDECDFTVTATLQERVNGDERFSLPTDEINVDNRFITTSDAVIQSDEQTTVTYKVPVGEEHTTVSFCVPPDGRRPETVETFIEACGGQLDLLPGASVKLVPYGVGPDSLYDEEDVITTDDGLFAVLLPGNMTYARGETDSEDHSLSEVVVVGGMIGAVGVIVYVIFAVVTGLDAFFVAEFGSKGRFLAWITTLWVLLSVSESIFG